MCTKVPRQRNHVNKVVYSNFYDVMQNRKYEKNMPCNVSISNSLIYPLQQFSSPFQGNFWSCKRIEYKMFYSSTRTACYTNKKN